jgi:hypothetical protein
MEKRYYNIDTLNKYDISIPTWVNPEILVNILTGIIAQEHSVSMDYLFKKYEKEIRLKAITQHEDITARKRW